MLSALAGFACDVPSAVRAGGDRTADTARYGQPSTERSGPEEASAPDDPHSPEATGAGSATAPTGIGATGAELVVVDPNGVPRPGILVRMEGTAGPVDAASGRDGVVRRSLAAGTYRVHAPEGCSGQLRVLRSSTAEMDVAEGTTTSGRLVVEVTPRYEVAGPVTYDGDAGWRVGEMHHVRFRLVDPCGGEVPSLQRYDAVRFVVGPGVEVTAPLSPAPPVDGRVDVGLRCVEADVDVELGMEDALDPRRRAEILSGSLMDEQRPPFCLQPR